MGPNAIVGYQLTPVYRHQFEGTLSQAAHGRTYCIATGELLIERGGELDKIAPRNLISPHFISKIKQGKFKVNHD
jgi:hypothetical protein